MRRLLEPDDITEELVPTPATAVYAVEVDGEAVLLDENANRLHTLNTTGTIVWASFDGRSSIRDIAADLADALGVPEERAVDDVLELTRMLAGQGLLEPGDCPPEDETVAVVAAEDEPAEASSDDPRFVPRPASP